MGMGELFGILFLLMLMQVVGTHIQVKRYRRAVSRLHKLGNVGIGSKRRRLGPGNIVLIACDGEGRITGGELMEGLSIFASFKAIDGIAGRSIYELLEMYESMEPKRRKAYKGHVQALEALKMRLEGKAEGAAAEPEEA